MTKLGSWALGVVLVGTTLVCSGSVAGCGISCNAIGAESGVHVELRLPTVARSRAVEVCWRETCHTTTAMGAPDNPTPWVFIQFDELRTVDIVSLRVTVRQDVEPTVVSSQVEARPVIVQPNGDSCPPTAYQVAVLATSEGVTELRPTTDDRR